MTLFQIDFEPIGKRVDADQAQSLLAAAQQAGIALAAVCGGVGVCGSCQVRLISGTLSPLTAAEKKAFTPEELANGWRLACQAFPLNNIKLEIPPESLTATQRLQLEGAAQFIPLAPAIKAQFVWLDPPSLTDLRADWKRLTDVLAEKGDVPQAEPSVMAYLSEKMRQNDWHGPVVLSDEGAVIGMLEPIVHPFGVAVDIGTTKMAIFLVDLATGKTIARQGAMNPQIAYGEDVVARIAYANQSEADRLSLQRRVVETLNTSIAQLCDSVGVMVDQVMDIVVVGNTAMHHLFAGLPVRQLGEAPYVAAVAQSMRFPARAIGLNGAPGALVYLPPNIAGYVGADHVAMLLASRLHQLPGTAIALDIGTNTEISLSRDGRLVSCSCASGPAFEGAHIQAGMRAVPGAIERAQFYDGDWHIATVDGLASVGICGSGILDVVAELLESGQIDEAGRFTEKAFRHVDHPQGGAIELVTAEQSGTGKPILVTRSDIREIQLAKAAIRSGVEVLLKQTGTTPDGIDHFLVAGAFGTYLNLESAVKIGLFPSLQRDRYMQIGNAAGIGAQMMVLNAKSRREAEALLDRMTYIELTTVPDYMDIYVDAIVFNRNE
ncbi:DUF4445 domain-containing protein [Chloroflexota bacterium]|nr:DUF4445 domain-containing protein [Chloroflexota bacterium]